MEDKTSRLAGPTIAISMFVLLGVAHWLFNSRAAVFPDVGHGDWIVELDEDVARLESKEAVLSWLSGATARKKGRISVSVDIGPNKSRTRHLGGPKRDVYPPPSDVLGIGAVFRGQALVIPNWVAGPSNFVAFTILVSLRVHAEEQMMSEAFGGGYAAYAARTKRLVPGVW